MKKDLLLRKFGALIRMKRVSLSLTQLKLAELAECSLQSIGNIERGRANVSLIMAYRISEALKVNIREILP